MLDQLMGWLTAAEANLIAQSREILPDNLPIIEQLFQDHQVHAAHIPLHSLYVDGEFTSVIFKTAAKPK